MRRVKRSTITAFLTGLSIASAGTAGVIGVLYLIAPPAPDDVTGLAQTSGPFQTRTQALPENAQLTLADDIGHAQARVAQHKADFDAQRALTRSIQQELQRVGCYSGAIDGSWSDATKSGMATFMQSLKVKLPVSAPDYILLTMLQGQKSAACGTPKSLEPATTTAQSVERPKARVTKTETRPVVIEQTGPAVGEFRTSVATANEPVVSPARPLQPVVTMPAATKVPTPSSAPLPGRMAIGAPVELSPAKPEVAPGSPATPVAEEQDQLPKAARPTRERAREARPGREYRSAPVWGYGPPSQPSRAASNGSRYSFVKLNREAP